MSTYLVHYSFFRHEKYQFLGPFSGEFKLPFRNSNFFFFHFLLYCKRKEYICLIHEKSLIKNCDHEHRTSQPDRPTAREASAPNSPRKAVPDDSSPADEKMVSIFCTVLYHRFHLLHHIQLLRGISSHHNILYAFNYLASFIFTIEYGLRIVAAPVQYASCNHAWKARLRYLFSFYGLIDFVAIIPFMVIYVYKETPHVHLVVLAYVLIIFKLIRYSRSFQMIGTVLRTVREELVTAYTACGIMLGFSGILMYYIERYAQPQAFENIGDGFWWAIVAFTTVGYGDIYPITPLGRLLSSIISLIGIAMIAIPTGIISSAFMSMLIEKKQKEKNNSSM